MIHVRWEFLTNASYWWTVLSAKQDWSHFELQNQPAAVLTYERTVMEAISVGPPSSQFHVTRRQLGCMLLYSTTVVPSNVAG
jgi:hypothetical protein